ncbi:hypothetical protein J2S74_001922 [Evansella vedderi]|uniref:Uncharacterized protein n=1 Tax=Evansella vedderi TaxID=38282 RepID=A0ABT9ZVQ6_9BACI|nr:hypothetical protein [Evansella vedderi]
MTPTLIRLATVLISWISLIFLPRKSFYKYLPVSIFTSVLVLIVCALSIPYKFWVIKGNKTTKILNDLSFVFGSFFAGTLWIFHLTFGKFKQYVALNLIANILLSYPLSYIFQKFKVYKLVNFKSKHVFLTYFSFSFLIYGYQMLLNRCFSFYSKL